MPRISFCRLRLSGTCWVNNNCDECDDGNDDEEGKGKDGSEEVPAGVTRYDSVVAIVEDVFDFPVSFTCVCTGGLNDNEDE